MAGARVRSALRMKLLVLTFVASLILGTVALLAVSLLIRDAYRWLTGYSDTHQRRVVEALAQRKRSQNEDRNRVLNALKWKAEDVT